MKNDRLKECDTIESATEFISKPDVVVKNVFGLGKKIVVCYYIAEKKGY